MYSSEQNKEQLIERLYAVINTEIEKPYEKIDADLVEACVELILELQGKNFTLSNEELEEQVRKIPFVEIADIKAISLHNRKKVKKRKILLVAAIIAILCALLLITSIGTSHIDIVRYVQDKFGSILSVPLNDPVIVDAEEFVHTGEYKIYTKTSDFFANEHYDVLIPTETPEEIILVDIMVINTSDEIIVSFDSVVNSYIIELDASLPQTIKDNSVIYHTKNNLLCHIIRMPDVDSVQIYIEHNNNLYTIAGSDEQILLNIIENMEEYK